MSPEEFLNLTDDQVEALDFEDFKTMHAEQVATLNRYKRRLKELSELDEVGRRRLDDEASREKTLKEVGENIGVSKERVRQIQTIGIMKIRRNFPDLAKILNSES